MKTNFKQDVYRIVSAIPTGKVMTFGYIAAMCGRPDAARIVGQIAHFGPEDLPWHRVVMKSGCLARGYPGGMTGQKRALETDGVKVSDNFIIDIDKYLFIPKP